jgi:hypothetical protein
MRDKWYGDNRDLVKWGVLLELSKRFKCSQILQVLYFRPGKWATIQIDGEEVSLAREIILHFRNTSSISTMGSNVRIDVIADEFQNRNEYHQVVSKKIQSRDSSPGIVFLDPDTGLEPMGRPGPEHVLDSELKVIWKLLRPQDVLVLYQHQTNRNGSDWINPKRRQFEKAIENPGVAGLAYGPQIARDVAFFFMRKE